MTTRLPADMRVLIVGGGIAGLTLAALMRQRGMHPEIIERTHEYGGVGYVLALWPAGSDILKGLGLYPAFTANALRGQRFEICDGQGRTLTVADFDGIETRYGATCLIERARLIEVLRGGCDGLTLRMATTIARIDDRVDDLQVTFEDGTSGVYDLIVGADGLRSQVRDLVFGDVPLRYLGLTGWAFWLTADMLPPGTAREYWGSGCFVGLYPAPGVLCSFIAAPAPEGSPDPLEGRLARIRETFGEMGGQVPEILAALGDPHDIWHDDFLDLRMDHWHRGRVVLLGDAAHAVLPTAGVGASMAMESAAVLADELSRTDSRYVGRALERFEARRHPRVNRVQRDSRVLGKAVGLELSPMVALRDAALRLAPDTAFMKAFDTLLQGPIRFACGRAMGVWHDDPRRRSMTRRRHANLQLPPQAGSGARA